MNEKFGDEKLATVRSNSSVLVLPLLILGLSAGLYLLLSARFTEILQQQIILAVSILLVIFFWFFPSLRYLTNRTTISRNRVVVRTGIIGTKQESGAWGEFSGVSLQRGFISGLLRTGNIHLHREFGTDLVIRRVPNAKKLTRELEQFLSSRRSVGQ